MSGDQLDLDLPDERPCGFTLVDATFGEEYPCDRPGTSWRWYQGHEHEDTLDRACVIHENPGGTRMAALVAEVRRLRALVDEPLRPRRIALPRPPGCDRHSTDAHPGDCPDCRDLFEAELERVVGNPFRADLGEHPTATSRAEGCSCTACTKFPPGFE